MGPSINCFVMVCGFLSDEIFVFNTRSIASYTTELKAKRHLIKNTKRTIERTPEVKILINTGIFNCSFISIYNVDFVYLLLHYIIGKRTKQAESLT